MVTLPHRLRNLAVVPLCVLICGCSSSYFKNYFVDEPTTGQIPSAANPTPPVASARVASAPVDTSSPRTPASTGGVIAPVTSPNRIGCDRNKVVSVGMTVAEVYASCWGRPRNISTSVVGSTKTETMFYDGYNYIYLENGIVKSVETSGR
jgi:hypothetical protein